MKAKKIEIIIRDWKITRLSPSNKHTPRGNKHIIASHRVFLFWSFQRHLHHNATLSITRPATAWVQICTKAQQICMRLPTQWILTEDLTLSRTRGRNIYTTCHPKHDGLQRRICTHCSNNHVSSLKTPPFRSWPLHCHTIWEFNLASLIMRSGSSLDMRLGMRFWRRRERANKVGFVRLKLRVVMSCVMCSHCHFCLWIYH